MARLLILGYGITAYLLFFITILYLIGFTGNILVPVSIDSGTDETTVLAIIINVILISIFAIQHSVMARPAFKRWWTKFIPASIERSTYVLLSSLALIIMYCFWQPMVDEIWSVDNQAGKFVLNILFWTGWATVFLSTFMINHFDLFGLRQVYLNFREKQYTTIGFRAPWLYRYMRHPIMTGFIIAFWATPYMTAGHLLFAVVNTIYILIALQFEERDLVQYFGDEYQTYRKKVPMLFPYKKID